MKKTAEKKLTLSEIGVELFDKKYYLDFEKGLEFLKSHKKVTSKNIVKVLGPLQEIV